MIKPIVLIFVLGFAACYILNAGFNLKSGNPKKLATNTEQAYAPMKIAIFSHRGFSAQRSNSSWLTKQENSVEAITDAARSYAGVEFDIRAARCGEAILIHDDTLSDFGLPKTAVSDLTADQLSQLHYDPSLASDRLSALWQAPVVINAATTPMISTLSELQAVLPAQRTYFYELKVDSKLQGPSWLPQAIREIAGAFIPTSPRLAERVVDTIGRSKLAQNQHVIISFGWWGPVVAKLRAASHKIDLSSGIDVTGELARPFWVGVAAWLGYDYFMPPHYAVTSEMIRACKLHNLSLVTWSSGAIAEEAKQLKTLKELYRSIPPKDLPSLGVIVNCEHDTALQLLQ